ncbi:MAG: NADH-quinone oxidoreductase subunit C [Rhodospirillales bacterium]|nr:NADH-quinone oxidoreductase subunit C [Rhodospirillales bacterium]
MEDKTNPVTLETVVGEVTKMKADGYRLITMTCVDLDEENVELLYHFDKDLKDRHFRMTVAKKSPVPSISPVYFAAFLIENEIEDHFGIKFDGLVLDFGGTLYLDEEVMRTPFCKYGVTRTDGAAGGEAKPASAETA